MRGLRICFLFLILLSHFLQVSSAPRKRKAIPAKPALTWVKDNSKLFTVQQAENLNSDIQSFKDSLEALPGIYVVTQNDYSIKSPYFRAFKSSVSDDKWYISEAKEYADDFVILIRPRNRTFTTPQLSILYNRNSLKISPFISPLKIERWQNEYNKYLSDTPDTEQSEVIKKLIDLLVSRFFDGQIRDYANIISSQDEMEIARFIKNFQDSTMYKVAVATTLNEEGEDSVFGRALNLRKNDSKEKTVRMAVEYKNLNADIVFVFYPKGVYVFSSLDKEKLSDKAIQNMVSDFIVPQNKTGKHKQAVQLSLKALSDHLKGEKPLDGMSVWEKLGAMLLGVGIPAVFGFYIFKSSTKKKKEQVPNSKPAILNKPNPEKKQVQSLQTKPTSRQVLSAKPEKPEEKNVIKPSISSTPEVAIRKIPLLKLTRATENNKDRGWTLDNTGSLPVTMSRIDDLFKPISPRNEYEKVMLEMIDYIRSLREYTDHEIAHSLGGEGLSGYLDQLYGYVDPAAVRIVFNRGLELLLKNYAERDSRVGKYITTNRH